MDNSGVFGADCGGKGLQRSGRWGSYGGMEVVVIEIGAGNAATKGGALGPDAVFASVDADGEDIDNDSAISGDGADGDDEAGEDGSCGYARSMALIPKS
jgi:hypothetical protein